MADPDRPAVAVVVPFGGSPSDARELADNLAVLELREDDLVVVADNTPEQLLRREVPDLPATVVVADGHRSAYSARNAGAAAAPHHEWLLFTDSDCRPEPDLLDRYFDGPPGDRTGLLVGPMLPAVRRSTLVSEYVKTRQGDEQQLHLAHPFLPFGATGNLLVRRAAFEAVGGFHEGIRSGGDADLCWRVQAAGWGIEPRSQAAIHHRQRETPKAVLRQYLRYGAGGRWVRSRHPQSGHGVKAARGIARAVAVGGRRVLQRRPREAAYQLADALVIATERTGALMGNRTTPPAPAPVGPHARRVTLLVDAFPELSETFVTAEAAALARLGARVRIEATSRARRPNVAAAEGLDVRWLEDDGTAERLASLAWLARTAPRAVLRDVVDRRAWGQDEWPRPLRHLAPLARRVAEHGDEHLHAHFVAGAALDALRLHRLLGVPYSVTAHGYDLFQLPRNLGPKLEGAAFATSGSEYTVAALRAAVPAAAPRVRKVVMGIDPAQWTRTEPASGRGLVLAVGRLVEKKGFADLLRAAALLRDEPAFERVLVVGDGPLRAELEALHAKLELGDAVALLGARTPEEVRGLLEEAAVVAIPCVIAADGDRDSMPVIAKEALAMEVPVVATAVCGLLEVVAEPWGRLVAPHDPPALAAALRDVLRLPAAERAAAGAAGRAQVARAFDVERETAYLLDLVEDAVAGRPPRERPAAGAPAARVDA